MRRNAASKLQSVRSVTDASEQSTCKMISPSGARRLVSLGIRLGSGISLLVGHNGPRFFTTIILGYPLIPRGRQSFPFLELAVCP